MRRFFAWLLIVACMAMPLRADVLVEIVEAAADTGSGTQDFTFTDFGTPKAALFIVTKCTTLGTRAAHAALSIGYTDGTSQFVNSTQCEDAVANEDCDRLGAQDEVMLIMDTAGAIDGEANFNSWITDGVRVTYGNNFAAAYRVIVVLFGGTDLNAYVGAHTASDTLGVKNDITAAGFEPDLIFTGMAQVGYGDTRIDNSAMALGISHNTGASDYETRGMTWSVDHGATTGEPYQRISHTEFSNMFQTSQYGAHDWTDPDANGASTQNTNAGGQIPSYLMLEVATKNFDTWDYNVPTSNGNDTDATPNQALGFVLYLVTTMTTIDSNINSSASEVIGVGVFTDSAEYYAQMSDDYNTATTDTNSLVSNKAVDIVLGDGTQGPNATFVSFAATGPTLNWANTGTAYEIFGFGIQTDAPSAGGVDFIKRTPHRAQYRAERLGG